MQARTTGGDELTGVPLAGLAEELSDALASDGLELFYQPVVSLDTGAVLAVEALVRWQHPHEGLILAARLLPLAARAGLGGELDRWVVRRACRQMAQWTELRGEGSVPRVSANISADRLADPEFVPAVAGAMSEWSVRPGQLVTELSETPTLLTMTGAARLAELRTLGVHVLLDDFGTGQASMFALRRLFLDGFKVDRSFVERSTPAGGAAKVFQAMVCFSEGMGVDLIVTGVETEQQLDQLRELGVRAAEGLLLLGPVPPETLMEVFDLSRPMLGPRGSGFSDNRSVPGPGDQPVTLSKAAAMLQISPSTLRRWADDGRVSTVRTAGGHRRFRMSDLRAMVEAPSARLRVPALPHRALPAVAEVVAGEGAAIAELAARSLYADAPGWFASEPARPPLSGWTSALAQAFADGHYDSLMGSLAALMGAAEMGGAPLAERHAFIERFSGVLRRRLAAAGTPGEQQTEAARTLAALAHELLDG